MAPKLNQDSQTFPNVPSAETCCDSLRPHTQNKAQRRGEHKTKATELRFPIISCTRGYIKPLLDWVNPYQITAPSPQRKGSAGKRALAGFIVHIPYWDYKGISYIARIALTGFIVHIPYWDYRRIWYIAPIYGSFGPQGSWAQSKYEPWKEMG